jgi:N-acetylglucosamine-6-phosphate deacetylase
MSHHCISNVRLLDPGVGVVGSSLEIDNGTIVGIDTASPADPTFDGGGRLLTPGLIDMHIHGIGLHLFEATPEAMRGGLKMLPSVGVTSVCPTLYTVMCREKLNHLAALADACDVPDGARVPGLHLEGPFLKLPGAGATTIPGDVELLADLFAATHDRVAAMSISPDTENILPIVGWLAARGVQPFITHTRADYDQTVAAIEYGAQHATHFYDVFPLPDPTDGGVRPVGAVEALLADRRCTVDFICDGVHVHPGAIRLALAAKGFEGICLITDANIGAGLPAALYHRPSRLPIYVAPGKGARVEAPGDPRHGGLSGSALTMPEGIANLKKWLNLPEEQIWAMGTSNPARRLGLSDRGRITIGAAADLVLWDGSGDVPRAVRTWIGGNCVFKAT